ncbi:MAG: hypothetical protein VX793_10860 [Pseudomonadota bacterium]|nr:hypothetical protein [Pseudomonadota bacterium]
MKTIILTGLTAAVLSANVMASNVTGYTAPQSGEAATAAGVDANFQALITAINDNNDRIAALEAANGETADLNAVVSGATYQVFFSGGLLSNVDGYGALERFGGNSVITFNSDGSLNETFNEAGTFIGFSQSCDAEGVCSHQHDPFTSTDETGTGTWEVVGQNLNVTWEDGDSETFKLSPDGNLLVAGDGSHAGTELETFLAVGVRLSSAP